MYIKCKFCDGVDNTLIYLADNDMYEFRYRFEDGLYLILSNKEIMLRDVDHWCMGREPDLRVSDVAELYEEMLEVIIEKITGENKSEVIDIDEIEETLIKEKYEQKWISKGLVKVYADGSW